MNFFKGLFSVSILYAVGWAIFQWGFMAGADTEKCTRRHRYHFERVLPAFAGAEP